MLPFPSAGGHPLPGGSARLHCPGPVSPRKAHRAAYGPPGTTAGQLALATASVALILSSGCYFTQQTPKAVRPKLFRYACLSEDLVPEVVRVVACILHSEQPVLD